VISAANAGTRAAKDVVTCITIPAGASVAKANGGSVVKGRYCWPKASLAPGRAVHYAIEIRPDRRQAQHLVLVASAVARNAKATYARARLNVLAGVTVGSGGYTG
jgi:hypothetical protein